MSRRKAPAEPILIPPPPVVVRASTEPAAPADDDVAKALKFIEEHACDPIDVHDLVKQAALSRRTLERRFRAAIGRSPHEEIRRVRMERARRLLVETRLSVEHVARASGLASAWDLHAAARKCWGMPPGEFRRRFGQ